jgi:hypothetical protein
VKTYEKKYQKFEEGKCVMPTTRISPGSTRTRKANYQCDRNLQNPDAQKLDARGVSYWRGDANQYTLYPGDYYEFKFTCTQPRCHESTDNCNLAFNAIVTDNSDPSEILETRLHLKLNSYDYADFYLPGTTTHERNFQATDIGRNNYYYEIGENTLRFENPEGSSCTVQIDNIQVIRIYSMCCLYCDLLELCNDTTGCGLENSCKSESSISGQNFVSRVDHPCNLGENDTIGYTFYEDRYFTNPTQGEFDCSIIMPGDSLQWNFDFSDDSEYAYAEKAVTLFNFNQIYLDPADNNTSQNDDVELIAYLNGEEFTRYYLSKVKHSPSSGIFPTIDLAALSSYNDSGSNSVKLTNNSDVRVKMSDGTNGDGINIYRTYYETPNVISRVQHCSVSASYTSTYSVSLPNPPISGNSLIAVIGNCSPNGVATSYISQTGVTWTAAYMAASSNNVAVSEIWYGTVGSNASQTVTIHATGSNYYHVCEICEYHGLASSPLDKTASSSGYSNIVDSGTTAITSQANELWVSALCGTSGSDGLHAPSTGLGLKGYTMLNGKRYNSIAVGFLENIVISKDYANVQAVTSGSPAWAGCIATFKGA